MTVSFSCHRHYEDSFSASLSYWILTRQPQHLFSYYHTARRERGGGGRERRGREGGGRGEGGRGEGNMHIHTPVKQKRCEAIPWGQRPCRGSQALSLRSQTLPLAALSHRPSSAGEGPSRQVKGHAILYVHVHTFRQFLISDSIGSFLRYRPRPLDDTPPPELPRKATNEIHTNSIHYKLKVHITLYIHLPLAAILQYAHLSDLLQRVVAPLTLQQILTRQQNLELHL